MSNQFNTNQSSKQKKRQQHTNFVEALKSIGSNTVKSVKQDVLAGGVQDSIDSVFGHSPQASQPDFFRPEQNQPDWLKEREEQLKRREHIQRQKEVNLTPIFDRRQEEVKAQIKSLREELAALAKDLGKMGHSIQKAIEEEIENPGTYHISFFEKLRRSIVTIRKQVSDSPNWLEVSQQRKAAQKKYWGNVKKSGTKYMLSHDRAVATQTG